MKIFTLAALVFLCAAFIVSPDAPVNNNDQLQEYVAKAVAQGTVHEVLRLDLRWSEVNDAGLPYLKPLVHLEVLDLSWTMVSDTGLVQLHALTGLNRVFLEGTQVSDAGIRALRAALPGAEISR